MIKNEWKIKKKKNDRKVSDDQSAHIHVKVILSINNKIEFANGI